MKTFTIKLIDPKPADDIKVKRMLKHLHYPCGVEIRFDEADGKKM